MHLGKSAGKNRRKVWARIQEGIPKKKEKEGKKTETGVARGKFHLQLFQCRGLPDGLSFEGIKGGNSEITSKN